MRGRGERPLLRYVHRRVAASLGRRVVSSHRWVWCVLVLVSFFGCRGSTPMPPPGSVPPAPKAFWLARPELPAFTDDLDRESLSQALQRSLEYARRLQPDQTLPWGERLISGTTLVQTLEAFQQVVATASTPAALQQAIRERFHVLQSPGRDERGEVLFTGYYEIELEGSLVPSARFPYPLYKRPPDLVDVGQAIRAAARCGARAWPPRARRARIIRVVKLTVRESYGDAGWNSSGCATPWMVSSCTCRAPARYASQTAGYNVYTMRRPMATHTTALAASFWRKDAYRVTRCPSRAYVAISETTQRRRRASCTAIRATSSFVRLPRAPRAISA